MELRFVSALVVLATLAACGTRPAGGLDGTDPAEVREADLPTEGRLEQADAGGQGPTFEHQVLVHEQTVGLSGLATGHWGEAALTYAPIPVPPHFSHVLTFQVTPMMPPLRRGDPSQGPLLLFSDDFETIVFSPLDHFFVSLVEFADGEIRYGLNGEVDEVPAGFIQRFLLVRGQGINATVARWGELLQEERGRVPPDRYADAGLARLSYWTDNGAYYYYRTEPGMDAAQTLLAVKAEADAQVIPYGSFQLDSWWYFKEPGGALSATSGLVLWEPQPALFPEGLGAFQAELGLPLILHNRWLAVANGYTDQFDFFNDQTMALPLGPGLFDRFMADAARWGAITYEQDWLVTQYWGLSPLRGVVGVAEEWMGNMHVAAAERGLTMQLCMAGAANLLDALDRPAVTTVRTSIDYAAGISKESFWPPFHIVNMVAGAVGVWPFKDNFQSAEKHAEAEALVAALSAGMVGIGDGLGRAQREIIMRTCRADGLLLKPDRPATPVDAIFLPHQRPLLATTWSERTELGRTLYLAAYHLAADHPDRSAMDRAFALVNYDGRDLDELFVFPAAVTDWHVDLEADLGWSGPAVLFNWRTGEARVVRGGFDIPAIEELYGFAYFILAPIAANGLALIGEPARYVTLADRRFLSAAPTATGFAIELEGAPGEEVELLAYDTLTDRKLPMEAVTLDSRGQGQAVVGR